MGDELVARVATLVGVAVAGELEGVPERVAVDRRDRERRVAGRGRAVAVTVAADGVGRRRVELLDDREEVGEKLAVGYVCLSPSRNRRPS
jgi:hypothetical protein